MFQRFLFCKDTKKRVKKQDFSLMIGLVIYICLQKYTISTNHTLIAVRMVYFSIIMVVYFSIIIYTI